MPPKPKAKAVVVAKGKVKAKAAVRVGKAKAKAKAVGAALQAPGVGGPLAALLGGLMGAPPAAPMPFVPGGGAGLAQLMHYGGPPGAGGVPLALDAPPGAVPVAPPPAKAKGGPRGRGAKAVPPAAPMLALPAPMQMYPVAPGAGLPQPPGAPYYAPPPAGLQGGGYPGFGAYPGVPGAAGPFGVGVPGGGPFPAAQSKAVQALPQDPLESLYGR